MTKEKKDYTIFWLDNFNGKARGGVFIRSGSTLPFIHELREDGFNPVAIKIPNDRSDKNIEILLEKNQKFIDAYESKKRSC